jgi:2-methylcitrate dehydratase PrpD
MCTHGAITGVLDLVKEHTIQPGDVNKVEIITSRYVNGLTGSPFEIRDNPQVDAQFSGPYTVAASIIRRKFGIGEIQEDSIRDPQMLALAKKVECTVDDSIKTYLTPVTVRIDLKNGGSFSKKVEVLKGNPGNPMTEEEAIEKFNDCVRSGMKKISDRSRNKLVQLILHLETLRDVRELLRSLKESK